MSNRTEIPLTDDVLRSLHRETLDQCPPSFLLTIRQALLDLLPPERVERIVTPDEDPRYQPIRIGRRLAQALNLNEVDKEIVSWSFGTRVNHIAAERLKPAVFLRATSPRSSANPEFDASTNQLIAIGERLATVFTLPDLDPVAARHALEIAARDLAISKGTR